jgi:hypothetical protein
MERTVLSPKRADRTTVAISGDSKMAAPATEMTPLAGSTEKPLYFIKKSRTFTESHPIDSPNQSSNQPTNAAPRLTPARYWIESTCHIHLCLEKCRDSSELVSSKHQNINDHAIVAILARNFWDWFTPNRDSGYDQIEDKPVENFSNAAHLPRKVPVKVEPKVFFANERTYLAWLHMAVRCLFWL